MPKTLKKTAKLAILGAGTLCAAKAVRAGVTNLKEYRTLGKEQYIAEKQRAARAWHPFARSHGFAHVGVTVSDFNASVQWYSRLFGMKLINYLELEGEELAELAPLYHVPDLRKVRLGFMVGPFGMIELFQFDPPAEGDGEVSNDAESGIDAAAPAVRTDREIWNRPGYTHIAFNVSDLPAWIDKLRGEGLEFVIPPHHSDGTDWVFFRDPDGNLVELMDMHATRLAVQHIGPLVGRIMEHTSLKRFYK